MEFAAMVYTTTRIISLGVNPTAEQQSSAVATWHKWAMCEYRRAAWRRVLVSAAELVAATAATIAGGWLILRSAHSGPVMAVCIGAAVGYAWTHVRRVTIGRSAAGFAMFVAMRRERSPIFALTPHRRTAYAAMPRVDLIRDDGTGEISVRVVIRDGM